jgi:hypothetical protein
MQQMQFRRMLRQEEIRTEVSKHIMKYIYPHDDKIKLSELKDIMKFVDKNIYAQLLDNPSSVMTYDQFKTRAYEKLQNKHDDDRYYCYDDLKAILPKELSEQETKTIELIMKTIHNKKSIADVTKEDSLRVLEPWESNTKCLRSMFNIGSGVSRLRKKRKSGMTFGSSSLDRPLSQVE